LVLLIRFYLGDPNVLEVRMGKVVDSSGVKRFYKGVTGVSGEGCFADKWVCVVDPG
jgi:hypothetical protein